MRIRTKIVVVILAAAALLGAAGCDNRCGRRGQDICGHQSSW